MMGLGSGMGWMWVFWLLLVLGVVLLAVVTVRAIGGGITPGNGGAEGARPQRSPARQVLDERYARGELSTEEYREWLRVMVESG